MRFVRRTGSPRRFGRCRRWSASTRPRWGWRRASTGPPSPNTSPPQPPSSPSPPSCGRCSSTSPTPSSPTSTPPTEAPCPCTGPLPPSPPPTPECSTSPPPSSGSSPPRPRRPQRPRQAAVEAHRVGGARRAEARDRIAPPETDRVRAVPQRSNASGPLRTRSIAARPFRARPLRRDPIHRTCSGARFRSALKKRGRRAGHRAMGGDVVLPDSPHNAPYDAPASAPRATISSMRSS